MKTIAGENADFEFTQLVKTLKGDHMHWCAVLLTWEGQDEPRWHKDPLELPQLSQKIHKTLGAASASSVLLSLSSGALLVVGENISFNAYQGVAKELKDYTAQEPAKVEQYDLSAAWEPFFAACKLVYTPKAGAGQVIDKAALAEKLQQEMQAVAKRYSEPHAKRRDLTLLFVEDEPSIRQLLNTLLMKEKYQLRFAANGVEAVRAYIENRPHIVFLDINLPDISGLQVLDIISKNDPWAYPVMLTGNAAQEDVSFAKARGIKGYIVKPFSLQKLNDCLMRYRQS